MSNPSIYEPTMYAIDPSGTKLGRIRLQDASTYPGTQSARMGLGPLARYGQEAKGKPLKTGSIADH